MRALLTSPLGFLIGLSLGALGGGGSILAIPALVYAAGQDPKAAATTSLLLVGTAAVIGMATHWQAGRVRVGTGIAFGLTGIGGSLAGTALNRHIDANLLLLLFSGLVVVAAWRLLAGSPSPRDGGPSEPDLDVAGGHTAVAVRAHPTVAVRRYGEVLLAGTAVGFMTGFFGVGGGFIIVPALTLVLGLPMPEAVGTSLLVIAINSGVALSTRLATTSIDWATTAPFALAAVFGVLTGGQIADRLDPRRSRLWFAALLFAVAVYVAARAAASLL
jgi:uncharacterized membrane protein YfcA